MQYVMCDNVCIYLAMYTQPYFTSDIAHRNSLKISQTNVIPIFLVLISLF